MKMRLARQLEVAVADPLVADIIAGMPSLGGRAAMLAIRGATHAVVTGARTQNPDARCAFCRDAADSWAHRTSCEVALSAFSRALGRLAPPHLSIVLRASPDPPVRVWAAFVDFASVACATRHEVVSRAPAFLATAAAALAKVHVAQPAAADAAKARRTLARRDLRAPT